jgi:hypothetical protein
VMRPACAVRRITFQEELSIIINKIIGIFKVLPRTERSGKPKFGAPLFFTLRGVYSAMKPR